MNNDSDTSADLQINILDNLGDKINLEKKEEVKKPESSDTDYYLNLLANQSKVNNESMNNSDTSSSLSEILESTKDSDSDSESDEKKSSESSRKSSSSSSKAKYEKINLSPKHTIKSPSPKKQPAFFEPPNFEVKKELSPQEARMKKIELLRKLSELKAKGYELSKSYNFDSSIHEIEYEFEL